MNDEKKDDEIRYLKAIIKDMMNNQGIDDFEDYRRKSYCQHCMREFRVLRDIPRWKSLADGCVYGIVIVVFLVVMAVMIGLWKG